MAIYIRGFALPPLLEKLINDDIWIPNYQKGLRIPQQMLSAIGIQERIVVVVCDLEHMKLENSSRPAMFDPGFDSDDDEIKEDIEEWRISFRYESSLLSGKQITDHTWLDVDKAVLIAYDQEDNNIWLDYRPDHENPRVVILDWDESKWKVLTSDFETFAKGVGLTK